MAKKILISYCGMISGGSTSALIPSMDFLSSHGYEVDLALYRHDFPYMDSIPKRINVLPQIKQYKTSIFKAVCYVLKGYLGKYLWYGFRYGKKACEYANLSFQVNELSAEIEKQYDVCIGFMEGWSDEFALFRAHAKKKITWVHLDYKKVDSLVLPLEKQYLRHSDCIVCVSKDCQDSFIEVFPDLKDKTICIENIVSKDYLLKKAEEVDQIDNLDDVRNYSGFKILSVCRLSLYHKGLDRMVWAAKELKEAGIDFRWYLIGDGPDKCKFVELIQDEGLEKYFILLGFRSNPYPFYRYVDIMCMPSRYEGKPIAITEAMLLQLPVVVTEYASAKEQIESNFTGIVAENTDYSIGKYLIEMAENPEIIKRIKKNLLGFELDNSKVEYRIEQLLN